MNVSSGYCTTNGIGYSTTKNAPQTNTSSKAFVISNQEMPKVDLKPIRPITFIGYDEFNPFEDIAKTGSFKLPELMQTKTEPTRSDEEILKDIEELAKEHARTGLSKKDDKRFAELINEYVSSVSPDRESILKSNSIAIRGNNIIPSGDKIIATRSDGYYTQVDYDRGGGNVTSLVYDNNGNLQPGMVLKGNMYDGVGINNGMVESGNFYDDNGELVMNFLGGKLCQSYTKAEGARLQEIVSKYNTAYDNAYDNAYDVATGNHLGVNF